SRRRGTRRHHPASRWLAKKKTSQSRPRTTPCQSHGCDPPPATTLASLQMVKLSPGTSEYLQGLAVNLDWMVERTDYSDQASRVILSDALEEAGRDREALL